MLVQLGHLGFSSRRKTQGHIIPPSALLWLDASDSGTIIQSAGSVSQWNDKSGNDYNAVQANVIHQPTTNMRVINSLNALDFDDGTNSQFLNLAYSDLYSGMAHGESTIFVVGELDAAGSGYDAFIGGESASTANRFFIGQDGTDIAYVNGIGSTIRAPKANSNAHIYSMAKNASNLLQGYVDGVLQGSQSFTDEDLVNINIGSNDASGGFDLNGSIGEVIIYNRLLTDTESNLVGQYLAGKWGISWTDI